MITLNDFSILFNGLIAALLFAGCQSSDLEISSENYEYLFKDSIIQKQYFQISGMKDQIFESENGTVVFIQKGSFLNGLGKPFEGQILIEYAEILSIEELIKAGIETTSEDGLIKSEGIFYINAMGDGKQLKVDPNLPINIQIPTSKRLDKGLVYELVWDKDKNLRWINPTMLENYLTSVDLSVLNFLPEGFYEEVANEAPFSLSGLNVDELVDSLYLDLAGFNYSSLQRLSETKFQEGYSNVNSKILYGKYTSDSFEYLSDSSSNNNLDYNDFQPKIVNPISVSLLKKEPFQNTLISTREFEHRMSLVHQTCDNAVLELYLNNLDENLWEIDEMAAHYLEENRDDLGDDFLSLSKQKLTKVEGNKISAKQFKNYYKRAFLKLERELKKMHQKRLAEDRKLNKIAHKREAEYKKILWKRERYRMEKYNLKWGKTGWFALGSEPIIPKESFTSFQINSGNNKIDASSIYVVIPEIKSVYNVNKWNGRLAYLPQYNPYAVGIGYLNEEIFFDGKPFLWEEEHVELELKKIGKSTFNDSLRFFDNYKSFNQIKVDLEYNRFFYDESKRQENIRTNRTFQSKLREIAFPCLANDIKLGEMLFKSQCASCHHIKLTKELTGPALNGIHERRAIEWLIKFTRNSQRMISEGDPQALELWAEWGPTVMNDFSTLNDSEIKAIYEYIKVNSD